MGHAGEGFNLNLPLPRNLGAVRAVLYEESFDGYIDDVNGWSFLGGPTEDIDQEALELARMYRTESAYFKGKKAEDIPFEVIGKLVRKVSADQWVATYKASFTK